MSSRHVAALAAAAGPPLPPATLLGPSSNSFYLEGGKTQGWSSLIGIVTAICGNVLISFALNTQRYAHLRLGRDRDRRKEDAKAARKQQKSQLGTQYGAAQQRQEEVAEQRARENARSRPSDDLEEPHETDALIPKLDKRKSYTSTSSSTTTASGAEDYDEKDDDAIKSKSYLKSPIWWLGIGMMTVGEAGNFLAYGFAPASIVSPLGVVALISNCLIAPLLLHEKFRLRDGLGVIIATAGCVTVVMSASGSNPRLTPDRIWHYITRWEFETYLGLTIFLMVVLVVASNKFGDRTILIDIGLVGLFGGYTALATKGVASLLSNTIWRVVTFPITYLLVAVLVFTAVMQIKYLNRALQRFSSTQVIPTQFVMFTISVIVGSAVLYRDFERTTTQQAVEFIGGCALTFFGVWCITSGRKDDSAEHDEEGQQEDQIKLIDDEDVRGDVKDRNGRLSKRNAVASGSRPIAGQRAHTMESIPNMSVTPDFKSQGNGLSPSARLPKQTPLTNRAFEISHATNAAIHDDAAQLPQTGPNRQHAPKMHATTSEPVVPTIHLEPAGRPVNLRAPSTPLTPVRSNDNAPSTPTREQQQHFLDPSTPTAQATPSSASRSRLVSRNSIIGLLPGPLTSPLSGSLSAIVADSLRRGVDPSPAATLRRARRAMQQHAAAAEGADAGTNGTLTTTSSVPPSLQRHSVGSGSAELPGDGFLAAAGEAQQRQSRGRSLSATIGELFSSSSGKAGQGAGSGGDASAEQKKGKPNDDDDEADVPRIPL